jgi:hypothetical protein
MPMEIPKSERKSKSRKTMKIRRKNKDLKDQNDPNERKSNLNMSTMPIWLLKQPRFLLFQKRMKSWKSPNETNLKNDKTRLKQK